MYHSQPQFEWVSTENGHIEESGREFSPAWTTPKNSASLFDLQKSQSPTPPPRRSTIFKDHVTENYPNLASNGTAKVLAEDLQLKINNYGQPERNFGVAPFEGLLKVRNDNVIDMRMREEKMHRFDGPNLVESRTKYTKETYFGSPKSLHDYPPKHYELSPRISGRSHSTFDSDTNWNSGRYKIYDIPFETTHFPTRDDHPVVGMEAQITKNRRNSDVSRDFLGSSHLKSGDYSTLGSRPESGYASGTGGYLSSLEISLPRSDSTAWTPTGSPALSSRQSQKTWLASPKSPQTYLTSPKSLEVLTPTQEIVQPTPRYTSTPRESRKHKSISTLVSPKSLETISKTLDKLDTLERDKKKALAKSELHLRKIPRTESIQSAIDFLKHSVRETKYVTAVFETRGGIELVIDDVIKEFSVWLGENSHLLGVACEVHWSVPEDYRSRVNEIKLKDALHRVLRNNNKRVLDLYEEVRNILPTTFYESKTEENCSRETNLNAFQGIYRRFYPELLALQDEKTIQHHRSFWELKNLHTLDNFPPKPDPASFLYSKNVEQLKTGSIVAVNLATIRLEGNDDKENRREDFIQQIIDTNQTAIKSSKSPVNVKYVLNIQQVPK